MPVVDKAASNFSIVCSLYAANCALQRLAATTEIQPLPRHLQDHEQVLQYIRHTVLQALDSRTYASAALDSTSIAGYLSLKHQRKTITAWIQGFPDPLHLHYQQWHPDDHTREKLLHVLIRLVHIHRTSQADSLSGCYSRNIHQAIICATACSQPHPCLVHPIT